MNKEKIMIDIVRGCEGNSISINETRVAGPKAWGGGRVIESFVSDKERIMDAIGIRTRPCNLCSTIYKSFDEVRDKYPLCGVGVFAKDEDGKVVYYIPCKDDFYDTWFTFDYCPGCGRKIPKE